MVFCIAFKVFQKVEVMLILVLLKVKICVFTFVSIIIFIFIIVIIILILLLALCPLSLLVFHHVVLIDEVSLLKWVWIHINVEPHSFFRILIEFWDVKKTLFTQGIFIKHISVQVFIHRSKTKKMFPFGNFIFEYLQLSMAICQHKIPSLIVWIYHYFMHFWVIVMSMLLFVLVEIVVLVGLMFAVHPLIMSLYYRPPLSWLNHSWGIRVNLNFIDLNGMT